MNLINFNIFLKRSLKTRVTIFTLIIFLVGIWSLAYQANKLLRQGLLDMITDMQYSTATIAAKAINDELEVRLQSLKNIASSIHRDMLGNTQALQIFLESRTVFQGLFNGGTFATGVDGIVLADIPISMGRIGINNMDRDYLQTALKDGKTSIGRPIIGKKLMSSVVPMATPILDADSKVIGALVGVIDLSKPNFLDKITQNSYSKTGGYMLIAPQHKLIVTGTDKSYIMQPTPAPGINPVLDRYMQGFEGSGIGVNSRGIEMLSSVRRVPAADWFLGVRIPTAEVFSPLHITEQRIVLTAIFVTLLAGGLTWWVLSRQLAPLAVAAKTVSMQSTGKGPPQPLPVTNPDEIGRLIGGFNHLLEILSQHEEEIRKSRDELEIRVQERTDDLAKTVDKLKEQAELLDLADDAIIVRSPDAMIRYWNRGAVKTYGWTKEEVLGKKSHELLKTQFPISLENTVSCALDTGQWEGELRHITKDGTPIIVASRWAVQKNPGGGLLGFLEINRDITERVRLQKERETLIHDRNEALASVRILSGLIPTCASCKKIRNAEGKWEQMEFYIQQHSEAQFTHGLCPECVQKLYPEIYDNIMKEKNIKK